MKQLLLFVCTALLVVGCNSTPQGFVINGELEDPYEGMVYLKSFRNKMFFDYDSAQVSEGKFRFEGRVDEPLLFTIQTDIMSAGRQFFIENVEMEINMSANGRSFEVKNSPENEIFLSNASKIGKRDFKIDSLITAHPASAAATFYFYRYYIYQLSLEDAKVLRAKIDPSLENSVFVKDIDKILVQLENVQVGQIAPDFSLPDTAGVEVSLRDFRGKYLLIDFWAAWCPPCRRENPNVVKTFHEFKDKGFTVLGVSLDHKREDWLKAIADDELIWTHVSDLKYWDSEVPALYGVRAIPSNLLIDPEGRIIAKGLMGERLSAKLQELLN